MNRYPGPCTGGSGIYGALVNNPTPYSLTLSLYCSISLSYTSTNIIGMTSFTDNYSSSCSISGSVTLTKVPYFDGTTEFTGNNQFSVATSCCKDFFFFGPVDYSSILGSCSTTSGDSTGFSCTDSGTMYVFNAGVGLSQNDDGTYELILTFEAASTGSSGTCGGDGMNVYDPHTVYTTCPGTYHFALVSGTTNIAKSAFVGTHAFVQDYAASCSSSSGSFSESGGQSGSISATLTVS